MSLVLEATGIRKEFPGVRALTGVDFDLHRGEVHVLLGENGAGKSTLMKILAGAQPADGGTIRLKGEVVQIQSPKHAERLGISIIYQEFNLIPFLDVASNIFLGREPMHRGGAGIDFEKLHQQAAEILKSLEIGISTHTMVDSLGVAQQQMVEVAKALSLNADILIMDEPTAALSREETEQLFAAIKRLQARGVSIIYISHRLEEVHRIGNRVTVLRNGEKVTTTDLSAVTVPDLIRLMVGEEVGDLFPRDFGLSLGEEAVRLERVSSPSGLENINLTVRHGEIVGLAGVVGAGRTEVARLIYGLDPVSSGAVYLFGKRTKGHRPHEAVRLGVGLLPEDRKQEGLCLSLSVRENVLMASLRMLFPSNWIRRRDEQKTVAKQVADLGIATPNQERFVKFLSGGNQQKVVLGRWLASKANLFIFDEPTRGIDVGAKAEVHRLMNELVKAGAAVLMISSELPEVVHMSDRVYVMRRGRIVQELQHSEVTQEKILMIATSGETTASQEVVIGAD